MSVQMCHVLSDNNLKIEYKQKRKVLNETHLSEYFQYKLFLMLELGICEVGRGKAKKEKSLGGVVGKILVQKQQQ